MPGTKDLRWGAGVPLAGRALLLLTYALILDISFIPLEVVICTCIMILTANSQPYKNRLLKFVRSDVTFWSLLAIFYAFEAAASFTSLKPIILTKVVRVFRIVVTIIPLIYMICITAYYVLSRIKKNEGAC